MTPRVLCLPVLVLLIGCAPKLQRPDVPPSRTLDPPLTAGAVAPAWGATVTQMGAPNLIDSTQTSALSQP